MAPTPPRRGLRWLWHELTRPRGSVSHRFYRVGRSSKSGAGPLSPSDRAEGTPR